jgi:hypothetical protein
MAFNGNTYRANRCARDAWDQLAKARDVKARAAAGDAYDWEVARIPTMISLARSNMRSSLFWRRMKELSKPVR